MPKKPKKLRIDVLLVERGLVPSRAKAQAVIMAGDVYVNEQRAEKAGAAVPEDATIDIRGQQLRYASRGGLKLEGALLDFEYDCADKVVLDVGASTGGFTDCVLQAGAAKVFAIDVGYGQLAWKLQSDERVIVHDRTNVRYLEPETLGELGDLAVIDCSFISLRIVLPATSRLLVQDADIIALVKPQFEVGRDRIGKGGIVRDDAVRHAAIAEVAAAANELG